MEKTIKLTWVEIVKWLGIIAVLISSFVANQIDIQYLKKANKDRKDEILLLQNELKDAGNQAAAMNEKLTLIYNDVTLIKSAVTNNQLNPRR